MGRTLLLIGGSGFFGKTFLDAFKRGRLAPWDVGRVIVVARDARALERTAPELLDRRVELLSADVARASTLPSADIVVHAASSSDARRYAADPEAERLNILAALDNYATLARTAHRHARIVYASSGAVYGQQPDWLERVPEDFAPQAADGLVDYKRDYAEAKRLAEARLAQLGEAGLHVAVARCFAFVGAYLPRDQHFAIGNFLGDALAGRPVAVNARKPVVRSWMHGDDLVDWLMTIAGAASPGCPTYNVGSDEALIVGDAAERIAARFGVAARVPSIEQPGCDRYVPSIDKARRDLGLELRYDFAAAIDDMAARLAGSRLDAARASFYPNGRALRAA